MKKVDLSAVTSVNGFPFKSGTMSHLQAAYQEAIASTVKSIIFGSVYDPAVGYILHGCVNTGVGSNYIISAGAVFFNGEVYQVPAATFSVSGSNVPVGVISTTYFSAANADPVAFTDGVSRNVHEIRQVVFQAGLSGSGAFNYLSAVDMRYKPQGCVGQVIMWKAPSGDYNDYFDGTGLGDHPLTTGWAICNGSNGTDNFQGRVPVGLDTTDSDFNVVGETGGAKTHTLTVTEMPSHNHTVTDPGHTHSFDGATTPGGSGTGDRDGVNATLNTASAFTGITIAANGGDGAHNNLQPYKVALFIQRVA
jgi:hypothetical protein